MGAEWVQHRPALVCLHIAVAGGHLVRRCTAEMCYSLGKQAIHKPVTLYILQFSPYPCSSLHIKHLEQCVWLLHTSLDHQPPVQQHPSHPNHQGSCPAVVPSYMTTCHHAPGPQEVILPQFPAMYMMHPCPVMSHHRMYRTCQMACSCLRAVPRYAHGPMMKLQHIPSHSSQTYDASPAL